LVFQVHRLLFRSLLDTECQPTTLVFLIQKEVAKRIATDQKESLLSLSVKVFGEPTYICTVKRGHFTPPPKIDSAILTINNINRKNFQTLSSKLFFQFLRIGFGQKRKQLLGNLAGQFSRAYLEELFTTMNLKTTVRAEDIPVGTWLQLAQKLSSPELTTTYHK